MFRIKKPSPNLTNNNVWIPKTFNDPLKACFTNKKYTGRSKKSLWCDLEEKWLGNSKIFFDGVFLYIFTSSQEVRAFQVKA